MLTMLVNEDVSQQVHTDAQEEDATAFEEQVEAPLDDLNDQFQAEMSDDENAFASVTPTIKSSKKNPNDPFSSGKYDEQLISLVQSNPPLYDYRLPTIERSKLKKQDLWKIISNNFGGQQLYT